LESVVDALDDEEVQKSRLIAAISNPALIGLVRSLPLNVPMPQPIVGARGDIYLEWEKSPRWIVVAVPQRSGEIAYSALFEGDRRSACYVFRPGSSHDLFLATLEEWSRGGGGISNAKG